MIKPTEIKNSKNIFSLLLLFFCSMLFAQTGNSRWDDYFSYSNVSRILEVNGIIYCSAENGIFSYNPNTGEVEKNSKVNDLNDVGISSFEYNPETGQFIIGYLSGEMDILGGEENHNMLEIPLHQSYTGDKRVSHVSTEGQIAIISGEFGLATFSLEHYEFMETCYFTQSGTYFGVKETAVSDGIIYAASDKGIFMHQLDAFITNFTAWQQPAGVPVSAFQHIVEFNGNVMAATGDSVYRFDGNNWLFFGNFPGLKDLTVNGNSFSITRTNSVINYDENLSNTGTSNFTQNLNTGLRAGGTTYGGSGLAGLVSGNAEIYPDGPYNNKSWSVTATKNQIWIAPGGMINFNEPQVNADGFSHFDGDHWVHHTSAEMQGAKDIVDIAVNPLDETNYVVSSWFEHPSWSLSDQNIHIGVFEFNGENITAHYNSDNSGLKFRERVGGAVFDDAGNLWIGQSHAGDTARTLMVQRDAAGNWRSIDLNAEGQGAGARKPFVYNGYGFLALPRKDSGLKLTDMTKVYTIDATANRGNLPSPQVTAAAVDENGVLWIGTIAGLRVLFGPIEAVQTESFQAQPVVIIQNGIPEAVLTDIQINDIKVDGANQKWVATESAGVYYFSEDGTSTVYHFTSGNSPLPSNKVNFISVDRKTGVVYFATDKGVVSFRSDAVEVGDAFGDVYSYPNPVRPGFKGEVTIKGLPVDADVRIVDINGNLIYKTKAAGGVAKWDTNNMKGKPVASGIYLVLMTNRDFTQSKQTKIAIVR